MSTQKPLIQTRIDAWTGIRGIAALWVVLFHLDCYNMKLNFGWMQPVIGRGELGVDLFFMLSGLVISYVYQREFSVWHAGNAARFWVLRFARIYPLHLLMLMGMALQEQLENGYSWLYFHQAPFHHPSSVQDFVLSLLNIHAWETTRKLSFNYPSWSVSAEWFAYLLFPLIAPWTNQLRSRWQNGLLILVSLSALSLTALFNHEQSLCFTLHLGLVRVLSEFLVGCALYNILKTQQTPLPYGSILVMAVSLLIPTLIWNHSPEIWIIALMALLLVLLPQAQGRVKTLLTNRFLVFGGEISYAIYMVHAFILHGINDTFVFYVRHQQWSMLETAGVAVLSIILTVMAAIPLHLYIEVPARNAIRRYWDNRLQRRQLALNEL
jgi:peptidoglycan/LPS O-acetylase OafA/YrhL